MTFREANTEHALSHSRGHFTFDNFWLPQRVRWLSGGELPWQPVAEWQSVGYFLTGTEGCLISQVLAKGRVEMEGIGGRKWRKRHVMGFTVPLPTKENVCAIIIHLSPFPLLGRVFFPIPARTGVALTTQAPSDCDLIVAERQGNHIWLTDSQAGSWTKWVKWPWSWWETERENHRPGGSEN